MMPRTQVTELEALITDVDFDENDSLSEDSDAETIKYHRRRLWSDCHHWTLLEEIILSIVLLVTISTIILSLAEWLFPTSAESPTLDHPFTIREQQIQNFIHGSGLMLNFHITHHAGTTMCARVGQALGAPGRHCNYPSEEDKNVPTNYPNYHPWKYNDTDTNIRIARQAYRFIAWERHDPPGRSLNVTNWEHPNLVSVLVIRDPISRLLAGSADVSEQYPGLEKSRDESLWWDFAKDPRNNNFALRILAGDGCCDDANTSQNHLDMAKELLSRFTFILDLACLDDNLDALAEILQFDLRPVRRARKSKKNKSHLPNSARIPFPDIHEYLKERNQKDIELYQWAKRRSLVQCLHQGES